MAAISILDQTEFYHNEAVQSGNAACGILEPWVQWFRELVM